MLNIAQSLGDDVFYASAIARVFFAEDAAEGGLSVSLTRFGIWTYDVHSEG